MNSNKIYEVVIIGAGPAGLTACLYALRSQLSTLLVDKLQLGGGLGYIEKLENFPGFPGGISGIDLIERIEQQLKEYNFSFVQEEIKSISSGSSFSWRINAEKTGYLTKAVILATGSIPLSLGVKGEKEFFGKGVSYCAVCDAPLFRNKDVVVIGGGNSALEEALHLAKYAGNVTIIHRRNILRADKVLQKKAEENEKIRFLMNSECVEIMGQTTVQAVKIKNEQGEIRDLSCQGIFIFVGIQPNTHFLEGLLKRDETGYIVTDENLQSSTEGIFACGDCRKHPLRQVITACGEGAIAAYSVRRYLEEIRLK